MQVSLRISIIIVNWNVCELLRDCLTSIYENSQLSTEEFEVIVVDNASEDQSVAMLRSEFPEVVLIERETNAGYGRGADAGYEVARGEFLWFLNPDILLLDDAVTALLSKFEREPHLGALSPRLVNADMTFQRAAAGAFPTIRNAISSYLFLNKFLPSSWVPAPMYLEEDVQGTVEMDWVSGAALMVRRKALGEYSADDPFFRTADDFDVCERVSLRGWSVKFTSDCSVMHLQWRSLAQQKDPDILRAAHRGGPRRFFFKRHGVLACLTYDAIVVAGHLTRWFLFSSLALVKPNRKYKEQSAFSRQYLVTMLGTARRQKK